VHHHRTKSRVVALLGAVVLAATAGYASQTAAAGYALQTAAAAGPALQTVALETVALETAALARRGGVVAGARRDTAPFSLLGVTWSDPRRGLAGTVRVRTRALGTGRWSAWRTLEADPGLPTDRRGATDPLWTGPADGVQARIDGGPLPAGLRLDLINPDAAPVRAPGPALARVAHSRSAAAVAMPTRPVPRMVTRAGWGANERIVRDAPEYTGPVEVFFVHHTATGNGYLCADSPGIVRGIQAYQVNSKGWDDIGYNFLVDKCGTVFEGRAGGVGRSVLGAHTLGFNTDASAIAVIGTYDRGGVSARVRTAIATVAAYKLGAAGNDPAGRVVLGSGGSDRFPAGTRVTLNRISGHRDTGRTECPGTSLQGQLPAIRAIAGAAPYRLRLLSLAGANRSGTTYYTRGALRPLWTLDTPSALINRFEVLVDGVLTVAAPGSHRTAAVQVSPGAHTVTVRALHLSGRTASLTYRVVADGTAPAFTAGPDVALRTGSLNGTVPVRLGWSAADAGGLAGVHLLTPVAAALGTDAHTWHGTLRPAVPTTFALRAADRAGNVANASVTRTPIVLSEAGADRTGTWRTLSDPAYLGGAALGAVDAGASATFTFTGRSAALAVGRGAASGQVRIVVDGYDQGLVDLRAPSTGYRQAVWTHYWPAVAPHAVRVQVAGTPGRPGVVLDGLVYLK
jgi:N-acetylmuramoyl-L-alanine amidase-like protein